MRKLRDWQQRLQAAQPKATWRVIAALTLLFSLVGCAQRTPSDVVVRTTVDLQVAAPIFDAFTRETGIVVICRESHLPRETNVAVRPAAAQRASCDIVWEVDPLEALRLQQQGLLHRASAAGGLPALARSPSGGWRVASTRARVLLVNTNQVPQERWPKSIRDLLDPQWYERCGVAKPLGGAMATHVACLFSAWGPDAATEFMRGVKRNARLLADDAQVAEAVASGALAFGLTNSDAAIVELEAGRPVALVYPDQGAEEIGTLFIPSTVAIARDAENVEAAERLIEYLLSPAIEDALLESASRHERTPGEIRPMKVNWTTVAETSSAAQAFLAQEFAAP